MNYKDWQIEHTRNSQVEGTMPEQMKSQRRMAAQGILAFAVPSVAIVAAYVFLSYLRPGISAKYDQYREFWGGNPSEVFSHWLDMVLMSGGAMIIGWFVSVEAFFRRSDQLFTGRIAFVGVALHLVLNGVIALVLDGRHGEGTVLIAYPLFFIPILVSSYYLLRRFAESFRWRPSRVVPLCLASIVLHSISQFYYEPSGTGGPNEFIVPTWLATVGAALLWAFIRSLRSGLLRRGCIRIFEVGRQPIVWGSAVVIILATTIYADRVRKPREALAFTWLNELETKLTDSFVEVLKRDHVPNSTSMQSKIPISAEAEKLLVDERIKGDNALRIYVPLNQNDYIFLWGNSRFTYCDVRRLVRKHTEEIDQAFINALIESDGTHQTGLYSVLWSPYMAGRVLKDQTGKVKAICVINAP